MDKAAIDQAVVSLRETIEDEIRVEGQLDDEEAIRAMMKTVSDLNVFNPKNPYRYTLATVPAQWTFVIQQGVLRDLYAQRAAALRGDDSVRAKLYDSFAQNHEKSFQDDAKRLLQVRPTSSGGRGRTH